MLAATGHRPDKLGGYFLAAHKYLLKLAINCLEELGPTDIMSGMALGWDMAWAEAGFTLNIPVTAAVPFKGQESQWPEQSRLKYKNAISRCANVVYVCNEGYAAWKMQKRNEYMVNQCGMLIALWDGSSGGTANCVAYASKVKRPVLNIWDKYKNGIAN